MNSKLPITLLPLKIGCVVGEEISKMLPASKRGVLKLKWPNDVLLEKKKVSGVLVEVEGSAVLIGVGVNVKEAPVITQSEDDINFGREAARLSTYLNGFDEGDGDRVNETVLTLARGIAGRLEEWCRAFEVDNFDAAREADTIVGDFSRRVEFGVRMRMRQGGWVAPLSIKADGQLLVRDDSGDEKLLSSDYMI